MGRVGVCVPVGPGQSSIGAYPRVAREIESAYSWQITDWELRGRLGQPSGEKRNSPSSPQLSNHIEKLDKYAALHLVFQLFSIGDAYIQLPLCLA